jgi:uncharacterized phiE125 gp8 family phage protein
MEIQVTSTGITEPIDHDDVKGFMGYPLSDTSQDDLIDLMIISAREFLEDRTALSIVEKDYKVYFDEGEDDEGWFELPVSPVDPDGITCSVNGTSTTFQQRGLKKIRVCPDSVISTIVAGSTSVPYYLEVEFTAGATSERANQCLLHIVSAMFNYREDGIGVSMARLPFDTRQMIQSLSMNL